MPLIPFALLAALPMAADAPPIAAGTWEVTSTVAEFAMPGVAGFLQRLVRGHKQGERKRVAAGDGVAVLLAPDPKAGCRVDEQQLAAGRYHQQLTCPQKKGTPLTVTRDGSYDAAGFAGRATVQGATPKGPLRIVLDQRAARLGG